MLRILGYLSLFVLIGSCKNGDKVVSNPASGLGDFEVFYERFLTDSTYQMNHIMFPLDGIPDNANSEMIAKGDYKWQREDWVLHKGYDPKTTGFSSEFQNLGNDIIIEKIVHRNEGYGLLRRFAKISGEWYLIYYAGLNALAIPIPPTIG